MLSYTLTDFLILLIINYNTCLSQCLQKSILQPIYFINEIPHHNITTFRLKFSSLFLVKFYHLHDIVM